jgi:hypothetical protein
MHTVVALIAVAVLIALGALQMAGKNDSGLGDFAAMAIIAQIITLYSAF